MKGKYLIISLLLINTIAANAQVVINEYCSSSTSFLDEYGDNADWIELYNTSSADVDLTGWHLSDKASNLGKWTFPSCVLKPHEYLLVFASGKDLYEYKPGEEIFYSPLIEATEQFSYTVGSSSMPTDWYKADYDDSKWSVGKGGFGYGTSYAATQVPEGTISVFVRKKFSISNLNAIKELHLNLDYDDGFVVYINGNEVARENLGSVGEITPYNATTPDYVNPLLQNGSALAHFDLSAHIDCLVEGENVFAIQIHNISETSSDLLLYPFLTAGLTVNENKKISELIDLNPKNNAKYFHTNFSISAEGEPFFLTDASENIVHQTDSAIVPNDVSRGLSPDGSGNWVFFAEPTPDAANTTKTYATARTNEITFSIAGGLQTAKQTLTLTSAAGTPIYYTTDGSVPTTQSTLYKDGIPISKTTVVRAISFSDDFLPGQPATRSFIFPDHEITLPIMALVTDPYNLYDYNYGIYVEGPNAEAADPHYGANYWQDWERPIYIEYYLLDGQNVISQNAGVKITGAWSRMSTQKPLAIHARKSYGKSRFDYQFFSSKNISSFKSFNLRNSGNDFGNTHMRDAMITSLVSKNNIDIQAYRPVVVYLNGEYWGIMNLRERLGAHYLEENYSYVDANKVDYIKNRDEVKDGSYDHYQSMLDFIESHSLAVDENYQYIKTQMDIDEYIEYMVVEIYCKNTDWPGNNVKFWRPQTTDGRWRWMFFDSDFGFSIWGNEDYTTNMVSYSLASNSSDYANAPWATYLLRNLVKNADFKREFINRFADRLNYEFLPENVNALIDSLDENITPEISYHNKRWGHSDSYREDRLNAMRTFADERPYYLRNHIREQFSTGNDVRITLNTNDSKAGYIQLNSLTLKNFPWTGTYFSKVPVSLRAVARPGYKFVRWADGDDHTVDTHAGIKVTLSQASRYTAVFEPSDNICNNVVINEINYKSADNFDTKDWVELYNTTDAAINISRWKLAGENLAEAFTIPVGTIIPPYGYVVVCANRSKLVGLNPGARNVIGNFAFRLGEQDAVQLFDSEENLVDKVEYNSKTWPDADGNGYTLALTDPFADNAGRRLWHANDLHGTPGAENGSFNPSHDDFSIGDDSFRVDIEEVPEKAVFAVCRPNPVTENAAIVWQQPADGVVRVDLFDLQGRHQACICNQWCAQGENKAEFSAVAKMWQPGVYFAKITIANSQPVIIKILRQ
ncbi:MAG: CotH kinase family protein [Salinivirgaceae bacterium]|nr:CotH kinase family protein [Salinivirgaceae bacterium]